MLDVGVVVRAFRNKHLIGQAAFTCVEQVVVALTIGCQCKCLTNTDVVKRGLGGVDHQEVLFAVFVNIECEGWIVAVRRELIGVSGVDDIQVAVLQKFGTSARIGHWVELDSVKVNRSNDVGAPPSVIADELGH